MEYPLNHEMKYLLTKQDTILITSALEAHIRQCEEFLEFNEIESVKVKDKVNLMKELLENM